MVTLNAMRGKGRYVDLEIWRFGDLGLRRFRPLEVWTCRGLDLRCLLNYIAVRVKIGAKLDIRIFRVNLCGVLA